GQFSYEDADGNSVSLPGVTATSYVLSLQADMTCTFSSLQCTWTASDKTATVVLALGATQLTYTFEEIAPGVLVVASAQVGGGLGGASAISVGVLKKKA